MKQRMGMATTRLLTVVAAAALASHCGGRKGEDQKPCGTCPACTASMICLEGASLRCDEEPYSAVACERPDGTRHGQYKSFEWVEDHWIETDGWYVDGAPVGDWVSTDATGRVVRVASYHRAQLVRIQWLEMRRSEELVDGHVEGYIEPDEQGAEPTVYTATCSLDGDGYDYTGSEGEWFEPGAVKLPEPALLHCPNR